MMTIIPAPHPRYRIHTRPKSYYSMVGDVLAGRMRRGPDVELLEQRLCDRLQVPNAVCVPQARLGIYLALKALIKPGQGVLMSPYTIADVVNMVICSGGTPVFADIDRQSCALDPRRIAQLIDSNTGAVLITHLHGIAGPSHAVLDICRRHGVPLVEDSAQALGARENGKPVGTIGDVGIYSFGMYKNINTWYGGAVVCRADDIAGRIRSELAQYNYHSTSLLLKKAVHGLLTDIATFPPVFRVFTYWLFRYAFLHDLEPINRILRPEHRPSRRDSLPAHYLARLTPFQARLGISQLQGLDADNELRIVRARLYREGLKNVAGLTLPPVANGAFHIYTYFPVQHGNRQKLLKWMMRRRRDVAAGHLHSCADLAAFSSFRRDCPQARRAADELVLLPTYPQYPVAEVKKNIDCIRSYFGADG